MEFMKPKHPQDKVSIALAVASDRAVTTCTNSPKYYDMDEKEQAAYELTVANRWFDWLIATPNRTATPTDTASHPVPNVKQKAVIDSIFKKGGYTDEEKMKGLILTWAEKVSGTRKYPESMKSVDKFIDSLKGD